MIIVAKRCTVYAKAETTPGTPIADAALFLTANIKLQNQDVTFKVEPDIVKRAVEGPSSQQIPHVVGQLPATMSFKHRAFTSGAAGTAPSYSDFLKAAFNSETIVAATSTTYAHSENQETYLTIGVEWMSNDGTYVYRRVLKGARGNAKLKAEKILAPFMWEEEFKGAFAAALGKTSITPVGTMTYPDEVANGLRFGEFQSPSGIFLRQADSFELDFGIKLEAATDTVDNSGILNYHLGFPTEATLKLGYRMVLTSDHDDLNDFVTGALLGTSSVTFGTVAGKRMTINIGASSQYGGLSPKPIGAAAGWDATIALNRDVTSSASNGFSVVFS